MPQQEFNPVPGVSTNADCEAVINNNATDAESRMTSNASAAGSAQSTANDARSRAINAQQDADVAQVDVTQALSDAATAQSTANTAIGDAATASSDAATAQSTANTAQSTANTAIGDAATANSNALQGINDAQAANDRITVIESGSVTVGGSGTIGTAEAGKTVICVASGADANILLNDGSGGSPVGTKIRIVQGGTSSVSIAGTGGTVVSTPRFTTGVLSGEYSQIELVKITTSRWVASGDFKEIRPLLQYRLEGAVVPDGQPFPISNVVAQGGFSSSFTDTSAFIAPITGRYRFTFNASLAWSETGGTTQFIGIGFSRKNLSSSGYTQVASQQLAKPGDASSSAEFPLNISFITILSAGQEFRIIPQSSPTVTPDAAANDRNECAIEWIGDV